MYCAVYKSLKKEQTYLYIENKDDFSKVPEALIDLIGAKELVMVVPKRPAKDFAMVSREKLEQSLESEGYYLQLPPPPVNYLKQRLEQQQANSAKDNS